MRSAGNEKEKQEYGDVHYRQVTGGDPAGERAFSGAEPAARFMAVEVAERWQAQRAGFSAALMIVVGALSWVMPLGEVVKFADYLEGMLMRCEGRRMVAIGKSPAGDASLAFILTPAEAAVLVEELHRGIALFEDAEATGDTEPAPPIVVVPPSRDTEPHPEPAPDPRECECGWGLDPKASFADCPLCNREAYERQRDAGRLDEVRS